MTCCTTRSFRATDVSSVRKLGFAGAPMTDGLLQALRSAFKPDLFVNHYGSSEIYTFTIDQDAPAKPGSAGRAGINQMIRVVRLGASLARRHRRARRGRRDHRAARRRRILRGLLAAAGCRRQSAADGWYFTGDTGYFDGDGDLFVTGRVDDMIITGGENVSPVEIESCLSLHPAVRRWRWSASPTSAGARSWRPSSSAGRKSSPRSSIASAGKSGLANYKRPRRYVFVRSDPEIAGGQALAPHADRGRIRAGAQPGHCVANTQRPATAAMLEGSLTDRIAIEREQA